MDDDRELVPLATQPPPPGASELRPQVFRPARPEDRGTLTFHCPSCGHLLIEQMSEAFIPRSGPVYCGNCRVWMSATGENTLAKREDPNA